MSHNLRDQLLGLGFKPAPKPDRAARPSPSNASARPVPAGPRPPRDAGRPSGDARRGANAKPVHARPANPPRPPQHTRPHGHAGASTGKPAAGRSREDIDLAKAYAIRAQREKDERIALEAAQQEDARKRREARAQLAELVKDKALNAADADIARHFPYGGKIKRIHVTAAQLKQLNMGALGVLQMDGRYLLVDAAVLGQAEAVFPPSVALKVDPDASAADDPYADPAYRVPDDLVW